VDAVSPLEHADKPATPSKRIDDITNGLREIFMSLSWHIAACTSVPSRETAH
jgi:hypothetical protein